MSRNTAVVLMDLLASMARYHNGSELGDVYTKLHQLIAPRLLADKQSQQVTTDNVVEWLKTFYSLPEPDRQILRVLLKEVKLGRDS